MQGSFTAFCIGNGIILKHNQVSTQMCYAKKTRLLKFETRTDRKNVVKCPSTVSQPVRTFESFQRSTSLQGVKQESVEIVPAPQALVAAPRSGNVVPAELENLFSTVKVNFRLAYRTNFGESVRLIGSHAKLGEWDIRKAPELHWTNGDMWRTVLELPTPGVYEYKYVVVQFGTTNPVAWQTGANSVLALDLHDKDVEVQDNWSNSPGALVISDAKKMTRETKLQRWTNDMHRQRREAQIAAMEKQAADAEVQTLRSEVKRLKVELSMSQANLMDAERLVAVLQREQASLNIQLKTTQDSMRETLSEAMRLLTDPDIQDQDVAGGLLALAQDHNTDKPTSRVLETPAMPTTEHATVHSPVSHPLQDIWGTKSQGSWLAAEVNEPQGWLDSHFQSDSATKSELDSVDWWGTRVQAGQKTAEAAASAHGQAVHASEQQHSQPPLAQPPMPVYANGHAVSASETLGSQRLPVFDYANSHTVHTSELQHILQSSPQPEQPASFSYANGHAVSASEPMQKQESPIFDYANGQAVHTSELHQQLPTPLAHVPVFDYVKDHAVSAFEPLQDQQPSIINHSNGQAVHISEQQHTQPPPAQVLQPPVLDYANGHAVSVPESLHSAQLPVFAYANGQAVHTPESAPSPISRYSSGPAVSTHEPPQTQQPLAQPPALKHAARQAVNTPDLSHSQSLPSQPPVFSSSNGQAVSASEPPKSHPLPPQLAQRPVFNYTNGQTARLSEPPLHKQPPSRPAVFSYSNGQSSAASQLSQNQPPPVFRYDNGHAALKPESPHSQQLPPQLAPRPVFKHANGHAVGTSETLQSQQLSTVQPPLEHGVEAAPALNGTQPGSLNGNHMPLLESVFGPLTKIGMGSHNSSPQAHESKDPQSMAEKSTEANGAVNGPEPGSLASFLAREDLFGMPISPSFAASLEEPNLTLSDMLKETSPRTKSAVTKKIRDIWLR